MSYSNGQIPAPGTPGSPLFVPPGCSGWDRNGYWEFQFTPATWARWNEAKRYAEEHFGRTLHIRTGWNVYRPYPIQVEARARACRDGNCLGAAKPGTSSHGGNWRGRDCLAIDVDPNGLRWSQVWEACEHAGFACGLITQEISGMPGGEPWHIIDFAAFGAIPTFGGVKPFPKPEPEPAQPKRRKRDMSSGVIYTQSGNDQQRRGAVIDTESGYFSPFGWFPVGYADSVAKGLGLEQAAPVTDGHYNQIKADCLAQQARNGQIAVDIADEDVPKILNGAV